MAMGFVTTALRIQVVAKTQIAMETRMVKIAFRGREIAAVVDLVPGKARKNAAQIKRVHRM